MSKVFISYRREDTADAAGRINDRLVTRFGKASVFKDVDSIPAGTDFRRALSDAVGQCSVMLVIIGRRWVDIANASGRPRLQDPNDFVRIEIETALGRNIRIIPVLVQDARMPTESEIPPSIAGMVYRQNVEVRPDPHFHRDMDQLIDRLTPDLQPAPPIQIPPTSPQSSAASKSYSGQSVNVPKPYIPMASTPSVSYTRPRGRFPTITAVIGIFLLVLGALDHYTAILGSSIIHLSIYIAIVGAVVLVIGLFIWMRGRSAA